MKELKENIICLWIGFFLLGNISGCIVNGLKEEVKDLQEKVKVLEVVNNGRKD